MGWDTQQPDMLWSAAWGKGIGPMHGLQGYTGFEAHGVVVIRNCSEAGAHITA